ncbi:unnamed protein product [Pleuronectes platessa]|uniref:Uncharacterized protein n=1 Tax=Pleuronectes platessa TaxID=8262 RepID=A0A9N7Y1B5_PLEPL|nr:unnamed protein product [Pleuronectes platessa]
MEQHLRIALCMVFIIGYLQAKPVCLNKGDLGLKLLSDHVTCDQSVNITSPSNVKKHCYAAALKGFQDGLRSLNNCKGQVWRIGDTAEALEQATLSPARHVNSTDCQWENKSFAVFVKDLETFAEQFNSGGVC